MNNDQIERITAMEARLDRVQQALRTLRDGLADYTAVREDIDELQDYLASEDWRADFEADEAGRLPAGLKRGVLSEDGIYDTLDDYSEAAAEMLDAVSGILRG